MKKDLEKEGWLVIRASGSHGIFDLVAILTKGERFYFRFIQCKAIATEKPTRSLLKNFAVDCSNLIPINIYPVSIQYILAVKVKGNSNYIFHFLPERP